MGTITKFELSKEEVEELEKNGYVELNTHWQLWKNNDIYSCTYEGNCEEFYFTLKDLLNRTNKIEIKAQGKMNLYNTVMQKNFKQALYWWHYLEPDKKEIYKQRHFCKGTMKTEEIQMLYNMYDNAHNIL